MKHDMRKMITNRNLTIVNFAIVLYFILVWLVNYFKIDFVLIGVLREMLSIPMLIGQIVFLVVGLKFLANGKTNFLTIASLCLLVICSIVTIGSFF